MAYLEHLAQVTKETVSLGLTGHLLHKATLPRLGETADLPNAQKQTQRGSQNGKMKKNASDDRTREISRKKKNLNEMGASNLPDIEFKTMVIRMFKALTRTSKALKWA